LVIQSPRIGFYNLLGSVGEPILEADRAALGPLFSVSEVSDVAPPLCEVLMIYARLQSNGQVVGSSHGLRDIIRSSNAPIVIVASENGSESCIAAGKRTGYGHANLVFTLRRKGNAFPLFFTQLFRKMFEGKSMLLAWVGLAPQNRDAPEHANCPETIFAAEVSHVIFK